MIINPDQVGLITIKLVLLAINTDPSWNSSDESCLNCQKVDHSFFMATCTVESFHQNSTPSYPFATSTPASLEYISVVFIDRCPT